MSVFSRASHHDDEGVWQLEAQVLIKHEIRVDLLENLHPHP